jgi:hypothetical protein
MTSLPAKISSPVGTVATAEGATEAGGSEPVTDGATVGTAVASVDGAVEAAGELHAPMRKMNAPASPAARER